jgi:Ser-tRNA(Ala) deacylase AlaX
VQARVDEAKRVLNARLHSAGHALDACVKAVGAGAVLTPTKGFHFAQGPYVEYCRNTQMSCSALADLPAFLQHLNDAMTVLVRCAHRTARMLDPVRRIHSEDIATEVVEMSREEASQLCGCDTSTYPPRVRVVSVARCACPCGGTHVRSTSELRDVTVTKVKAKGKVPRVTLNATRLHTTL